MRVKSWGVWLCCLTFLWTTTACAQDQTLAEGINLYWSGQYSREALDVFDAIIEADPDNAEALAYRGALYQIWECSDEVATDDYTQSSTLDPDAGLVEALQASIALICEKTDTAEAKAAESVAFGNPLGRMVQGELAHDNKAYDEAVTAYTEVITADSGFYTSLTAHLYADRAESLRFLGRFDEALADADKALTLDDVNYPATRTRALIAWSTGDEAEMVTKAIDIFWSYDYEYDSIDVFEAILIAHPDNAQALAYHASLAFDWYYDEDMTNAEYERALALGAPPGLVEGLRAYAEYDPEVGRPLAEASVKAGHPLGSLVLATFAIYDQDFEAAVTHYTQAIDDDKGLSPAFTLKIYTGRADALRNLGRYDEALADVDTVLKLDPENAIGLYIHDQIAWITGEPEEVLAEAIDKFWADGGGYSSREMFNALAQAYPDNAVALAYRGALSNYAPELAEPDYKASLALAPKTGLVEGLQSFMIYRDDPETARTKAEDSAQYGNAIGSYVLGRLAAGDGDNKAAYTFFSQALLNDDQHSTLFTAELYNYRGEALRLLGRLDESLADFSKALELRPNRLESLRARIDVNWRLGNKEAAFQDAADALAINPTDVFALSVRSNMYREQGKYALALKDIDLLIENHAENTNARGARAQIFLEMGQPEKALTSLNEALTLNPDSSEILRKRSDIYRDLERYDEAIADLDKILELNPNSPDSASLRAARAQLLLDSGANEKALDDLNEALTLTPESTDLLRKRADIYRDLGRYDEAIADLNTILALHPDDYETQAVRGYAYRAMNLYMQAVSDFDAALLDHPDYKYALQGRGSVYLSLHQYEQALSDADQVLEQDPDDVFSLNTRGNTYVYFERYDEALADFNHAAELDPNESYALGNRALMYIWMGDYQKAVDDATASLERFPDGLYLLSIRGAAYRRLREYEKALSDFNRVVELKPNDTYALSGRGDVYYAMGYMDNALQDYSQVLMLTPTDTTALLSRARVYINTHHLLEAYVDIKTVLALEPGNEDARALYDTGLDPFR